MIQQSQRSGAESPRFSIIVPVYNRKAEVEELLASLASQTVTDTFEVIIVEDGSTEPCDAVCARYEGRIGVRYFAKPNEGRSIARNYGMERARGDFFVFVDSDCVFPSGYIATLSARLDAAPGLDCFGGPDAADTSFSPTQKAINFAMTSFLTTGGIRGGKVSLEKFVPRTFNMGFSRRVYEKVGGFREMFSEDIDMSTRIRQAGFTIGLLRPVYIYHKRRVDFAKFWRQVYVFGMSRVTLKIIYPGSLKLVHTLPAIAVILGVVMLVLAAAVSWLWLLPLAVYLAAIFVAALLQTRSLKVAFLAVPASVIQITGYGFGFIGAYIDKIILGRGRDISREIDIRRGANERL